MRRRPLVALAALAGALVLAEVGLRVSHATSGEPPSHPDRSVEDEWDWAAAHLAAGSAELSGPAVYDADLGWVPRPHLDEDGVHTNSLGMRGAAEHPLERGAARRLLFVGDSYTFGFNVRDEESHDAVLAREHLPGWEVLNLGVSGYGPDQALLRWEELGVRYRPDVVVMGFYVRGYFRLFQRFRGYAKPWFELDEDGELVLRGAPVIAPAALLAEYESGARTIGGWRHSYLLGSLGSNVAQALERRAVERDDPGWRLMAALLERFVASARAAGAEPFLLVFPHRVLEQGEEGSVYEQLEHLAEIEAERLGLPCLGLSQGFRAALEREPGLELFQPRDAGGHLSARGNALAAELLADALRRAGLVAGS